MQLTKVQKAAERVSYKFFFDNGFIIERIFSINSKK